MEELTRKRLGRPRKAVAVPDASTEGKEQPSDNLGDGEVGGVQSEARAIDGRQGESWSEFVSKLTDPLLRKVWHPNPETTLIQREHAAFLPVEIGPKKGQLQDGTVIVL